MRGDKVPTFPQPFSLGGRAEGDGLRLAFVAGEEVVKERIKRGVAFLLGLLVEGAHVFGAVQLGHREGGKVAVRLVKLDQAVVEGEPLFKRLVGDALAVELDGVADGEVEERGAVGLGKGAGIDVMAL